MKCKWIEGHECKRENPTKEDCTCCLLAKIHKDLWEIAAGSLVWGKGMKNKKFKIEKVYLSNEDPVRLGNSLY